MAREESTNVSRDLVVAAYRALLGREPENEQVVRRHVENHRTAEGLLRAFIGSQEFKTKASRGDYNQVSSFASHGPNLEIALLESVIDKIVTPGMICCEIGAYSGAFTKRFLRAGCAYIAVEAYPPAFDFLKKKYGRKCKLVPAFVADEARGYRIRNKEEVCIIGERPVYVPSGAGYAEVISISYDELFSGAGQPDLMMVSGCNSCEALIGATSFIGSKGDKFVIAWSDSKYKPFDSANDATQLYTLLSQNNRSVFSIDGALNDIPSPLSSQDYQKKVSDGWKIFVSAPAASAFPTATRRAI